MSFQERLEQLMIDNSIGNRELARITGITSPNITFYKQGSIPKADIAYKIAKALNTFVEYLITGKESISESEYEHLSQDERELIDSYISWKCWF